MSETIMNLRVAHCRVDILDNKDDLPDLAKNDAHGARHRYTEFY